MKRKFSPKVSLTFKNNHGYMNYNQYIEAIKLISSDILNKYGLKKIGILALARGALPMAASISHFTGIRDVSVMQLQMTNSDNCFDYGAVKLKNYYLYEYDAFILLEDVIYHGNTTNFAINTLKALNKQILEVYALAIDENFIELPDNKDIKINYVYDIPSEDWLHFLWEEDITNKEKTYE